jgi:hypothetical protein
MHSTATKLVGGFIIGLLAVAIFHQGMYAILQQMGIPLRGMPWDLRPDPGAYNMPRLLNQMFWGGLWGILFAFLVDHLRVGPTWVRGLVFGMLFPMLLGSWLIFALIKGQPMFSGAFAHGFDVMRLRTGFLLNGIAFGIGLGLLYSLFIKVLRSRSINT